MPANLAACMANKLLLILEQLQEKSPKLENRRHKGLMQIDAHDSHFLMLSNLPSSSHYPKGFKGIRGLSGH